MPRRFIRWRHPKASPEICSHLVRLFLGEAVGELDPSMLHEVVDIVLGKLLVLFRGHDVGSDVSRDGTLDTRDDVGIESRRLAFMGL